MRVERQVGTTMVLKMIKMRTMKPKRLTELIISNKHKIEYKVCLLRDRTKEIGYDRPFFNDAF